MPRFQTVLRDADLLGLELSNFITPKLAIQDIFCVEGGHTSELALKSSMAGTITGPELFGDRASAAANSISFQSTLQRFSFASEFRDRLTNKRRRRHDDNPGR